MHTNVYKCIQMLERSIFSKILCMNYLCVEFIFCNLWYHTYILENWKNHQNEKYKIVFLSDDNRIIRIIFLCIKNCQPYAY